MSAVEQIVIPDDLHPDLTAEVATEGEWLPPENALEPYRPFYTELAKLKQNVSTLVFDVSTKDGMKHAKSYEYTLRKSRKPMKDAHQKLKVDHLEVIRRIDSQYNDLDSKLDEIIEIVAKPIREAEAREDERVAGHQKVLDYIESLRHGIHEMSGSDLFARLDMMAKIVIDESLEEFQATALDLYKVVVAEVGIQQQAAMKREAEEAELAALRAEKAARDQRDHEECIAKEAADKARAETEAAMERGRVAAEAAAKRDREVAEAREKADRARIEAAEAEAAAAIENAAKAQRDSEEKAAQAVRDAEERIRLARETEAAEQRLQQQKREADIAHKAAINREALEAFVTFAELNPEQAKAVVTAIALGHIPNVRIAY